MDLGLDGWAGANRYFDLQVLLSLRKGSPSQVETNYDELLNFIKKEAATSFIGVCRGGG
jgi:hypothetical protein